MEDRAYSELVQNEPTRSVLRRDDAQVVGSNAIDPRSAVIREARQGPHPRGQIAWVASARKMDRAESSRRSWRVWNEMHCTKRGASTLGQSSAGLTCGPVCLTKRRSAGEPRGCWSVQAYRDSR